MRYVATVIALLLTGCVANYSVRQGQVDELSKFCSDLGMVPSTVTRYGAWGGDLVAVKCQNPEDGDSQTVPLGGK